MSPTTSTIVAVPDWRVEMSILECRPRGRQSVLPEIASRCNQFPRYQDGSGRGQMGPNYLRGGTAANRGDPTAYSCARGSPGKPVEAEQFSAQGRAAFLPIARSSRKYGE